MSKTAGVSYRVHPVVRVVLFLVYSFSIALGGTDQLIAGIFLLLLAYITIGRHTFLGALRMLKRLRWLFLSILLVYLWLTPSDGGSVGMFVNSSGFIAGGERVLILVSMVFAVYLLLEITPKNQLVAALYWLAFPLKLLGVKRETLAVRLVLVMSTVENVQLLVSMKLKESGENKEAGIRRYALLAGELVSDFVGRAESEPLNDIEVDIGDAPVFFQWGMPLLLGLVMIFV